MPWRRPEETFAQLGAAINGPSSTIDPRLRNIVSQMASRAAGCGYCMAHTAHTAERVGIAAEKENALWEFERSPLFSEAERAELRVAQCAAQVPNAVTDADFAELKKHYTDCQIVDIVAVISLFGFLNCQVFGDCRLSIDRLAGNVPHHGATWRDDGWRDDGWRNDGWRNDGRAYGWRNDGRAYGWRNDGPAYGSDDGAAYGKDDGAAYGRDDGQQLPPDEQLPQYEPLQPLPA